MTADRLTPDDHDDLADLLDEAGVRALHIHGLTERTAQALETIAHALRQNQEGGGVAHLGRTVNKKNPASSSPVTLRSKTRGLALTLVVKSARAKRARKES